MQPQIDTLLRTIEQQLDWGNSASWQSRDFENLQQQILDRTGVSLSASTLRRIWGRVTYNSLPSATTLDALAQFAGYENWRHFNKQQGVSATIPPAPEKHTYPARIIWMLAAVLVVIFTLAGIFALKRTPPPPKASDYQFSVKPVTRGIPNSVIFTYDAAAAPGDSVDIQQSWDVRKRQRVSKTGHTHTSIYYEPGFYQAKLVVNNQIVKETPLLIPTKGWTALIDQQPVPVYLPAASFTRSNVLSISPENITRYNIPLQPLAPVVKFYNIGNFDPVPLADLTFNTVLKHTYKEGAAACQHVSIQLITDLAPIMIPLSDTGCISTLSFMCVDQQVSGKDTDLSGFGVDFSNWVQVSCVGAAGNIRFYVNGRRAYSCTLPDKPVHVLGLAFVFWGAGDIKHVQVYNKDKQVFNAFP